MKLLSSVLLYGATDALKCQVCTENRSSVDENAGTGDVSCWDLDPADDKYLIDCPDNYVCMVDLAVDWLPRGNHLYAMKRTCAVKIDFDKEEPCMDYSGMVTFKDCRYQCTDDNCNAGNDEIYDLTSAGPQAVESCNECAFYQDVNSGTVNGYEACREEVTDASIQQKCPPYANYACYDASALHKGYGGDYEGLQMEDFYRGCTPFRLTDNGETWHKCETFAINDLSNLGCKSTCDKPNCNKEEHQIKSQCYTCKGSRDGAGRPVGNNDDRCWENLEESMLADCELDEVCMDDLQIDWLANGNYVRQITRGCVKKEDIGADLWPENTRCDEGSLESGHYRFRDCKQLCEGTACNNDLSVGDLFKTKAEGAKPQMCQQCGYLEYDNGNREGVPECLNAADPDRLVECPNYADYGCYTATNTYIDNGSEFVSVERGCGTFGPADGVRPGLDCYDTANIAGDEYNQAVCKEYCENNNCNAKMPTVPNQSTSSWPSCVTCQVYFNDNEEVIGVGTSMDCRGDWDRPGPGGEYVMSKEAVAKYAKRCPNKGDTCLTDMEVDWLPRGDITYKLTRGCSSRPAEDKCISGSSSLIQYRDCQHGCIPQNDGNMCNDDLKEISRKLNDGRNHISQCVKCSWQEDADGNVDGNPDCLKVPELGAEDLDKLTFWCPSYARVACASARSFHRTYNTGDDKEIIEDFRHCSPFSAFPEVDCAFQKINGLDHTNCKHTCEKDNCNTIDIQRGNRCYACTATVDAQGRPVGVGDSNCLDEDKLHQSMLIDCKSDEEYCSTEMTGDWQPKGDQVFRIIRGCAAKEAPQNCQAGANSLLKFKDCFTSCENKDGPCNDNNKIFEKMSDNEVNSCVTCAFEENDDGTVSGNKYCTDADKAPEFRQKCPRYASQACFTGAAKHFDFGQEFSQVYKGCSLFAINGLEYGEEESQVSLPDDSGNLSKYSLTKTTCGKDNCNEEHKEPLSDADATATMCQVCSVVVDQFNKTIGVGQKDCWEGGNSDFQQNCGANMYCSTDMEIDWLPRGQHQFRLVRGCTTTPPTYDEPCDEGSSRNGKYKDCRVSCDPRLEGNSCNSDLDRVAEKFSNIVYMDYCYACEYFENLDGTVQGNKNCPRVQLGDGFAGAMVCPKYAHASCYTATSLHVDYTTPDAPVQGNSFEDYFRGCSPFTEHQGDWWGKHCETSNLNGFDHENCKELCFGPYCNVAARDPKPQCHVCSVTLDSEGNTVGTSDPNCLQDLTGSSANVVECAPNQPYCSDVMEIDWYGRGMQYVHFNRGCTKEKVESTCIDIGDYIDSNLKAVLCTGESCEPTDGPCNKDLKVTENFYPQKDGVKSCTTCTYRENDDGTVSGNKNCGENATDAMSMECPPYQSTACYVGSAKHQQVGEDKYETHKGCSFFETDGAERSNDFIGGVYYQTVKETCDSTDCNKDLYNKP